ncbi:MULTISPECIES: nuclear transport factor 2 family protein [unclassified Flavobacterium]|jgi:ketosteroid isomerase-like protein|uniref:nuclear transport factor 2 family protein n=1 Tax=unclassified Flavobacterium TaxID=196869 RepID=UPI0012A82BF2|nr:MULTISPECIES: nuclear transport factor 2 family protein [unclassified Flavobacterium]MBF4485173.1 nuclear transport factor 2 family protein [Flavobacterium sp. CSZ]QGK75157.1 nuclear transport factor 2 family protein [Flavobacterium sp. SLB02]
MKKVIIIVVVFLVISCNNQNPSKPMNISENQKVVKQYFEYFNDHDWKKMAEMYTQTADFKDPSLGPGIVRQSREQIQNKYAELNKIFPDLHDKVLQIYPSGEKHIIVEFVSTGTGPDNSKFELPICTIFTIENGLITKDFTYFDNFEE